MNYQKLYSDLKQEERAMKNKLYHYSQKGLNVFPIKKKMSDLEIRIETIRECIEKTTP